ncbi:MULTISPECIES: helix-turn-helix domain-containing protein [Bacillus]|uniref:helix-turn-helix domain-containing protein n=1 Tax=Bacillus TaxID=1386 RepID=UPI000BF8A067|nr:MULTISPECIES: helix-turn-helix transcriptional regulator [Bacillus]MED4305529.1 helix-turn-helix transcriptional regulator [Bacillus licheniformis]MED4374065.1 helix-turn-helix transcriptional regulator [Bacillus licheniformis]MED4550766.1 helix-turn-helix transcriptional regulator [Bacillus licheniformis]
MEFNHYKLKAARCLKGYSVEEMARRIGVDVHAYWRIESGKTQLKVQHLLKIAMVLEQPLTYFVEENEMSTDVKNRVIELLVLLDRLDDEERAQYSSLIQSLKSVCAT